MQEQKKYHQRKLAIIEMMELCDERMKHEEDFLNRTHITDFFNVCENSRKNTMRLLKIKQRLSIWLGE